MSDDAHPSRPPDARPPLLLLGVLGIVYGDIGTSPLYAFRECFSGANGVPATPESVLGILSLVTWSLVLVISVKYLGFILRADNRGEGGILALLALLLPAHGEGGGRRARAVLLLGLAGGALLCADAIITPAISILSAVEGLESCQPSLAPWIIPISLAVVAGLFFFQRHGTARISSYFGPVMLAWFVSIGALGVLWIAREPAVLEALSPHHAAAFAWRRPGAAFAVLGTLFLVVTGGEALYADMGHFNRRSMRWGWFLIVLPALLCNYFGQGARLLARGPDGNLFYGMADPWAVVPLVVLATAATVIASQAVITGMFSLASQAIQMGFSPRMTVQATSDESRGQIYVPLANGLLFAGCVLLILEFKSSGALAEAYGLAVSGTMLVTTMLFFFVMRRLWRWPMGVCAGITAVFAIPDGLFFASNLLKIPSGGWIPLAVGSVIFFLAVVWHQGRQYLRSQLGREIMPAAGFIGEIRRSAPRRVPGTAVYLASSPGSLPRTLLHNFKHNQILHETNVFVTVETEPEPHVPRRRRAETTDMGEGFYQVILRYGFRQRPDVPAALQLAEAEGLAFPPMKTTYFLGRQTLVIPETGATGPAAWKKRVFEFLFRNSLDPARYFRLPPNRVVELGEQIRL